MIALPCRIACVEVLQYGASPIPAPKDGTSMNEFAPNRKLRWVGFIVVTLAIIVAIVVLTAGGDEEIASSDGVTEAAGTTGTPPVNDVSVVECGPGIGNDLGGSLVGAAGTVTNHSEVASSYVFIVEFRTPSGVRYDQAPGSAALVEAGQTVAWRLPGLMPYRRGTECGVTQVVRHAV